MKLLAMLTTSAAMLASTGVFTHASAQEITRAQVRQELIQAENNGSRFVSDTSYPEVDPIYQEQVARNKAQHPDSGEGAAMSSTSQSGARAMTPDNTTNTTNKPQACVGPVSYCNIYFGS
jgi:hypothetical protein